MKLAHMSAIQRPQNAAIDYAHYASRGLRLRNRCLRKYLRRLLPHRALFIGFRISPRFRHLWRRIDCILHARRLPAV